MNLVKDAGDDLGSEGDSREMSTGCWRESVREMKRLREPAKREEEEGDEIIK